MFSRLLLVSLLTLARAGTPDNFFFLVHDSECTESRSMQEYYDEVLHAVEGVSLEEFELEFEQKILPCQKAAIKEVLFFQNHCDGDIENFPAFLIAKNIIEFVRFPGTSECKLRDDLRIMFKSGELWRMFEKTFNDTEMIATLKQQVKQQQIFSCGKFPSGLTCKSTKLQKLSPEDDLTVPLKDLSPKTRRHVVVNMLDRLVGQHSSASKARKINSGSVSIDYLPKLNIDIIDASRRLSKKSISLLMENLPCVLHPVESNFERHISATPNDEYYAQQWHLHKDDYGANVAGAWECSQGGKNRVLMAHVDTGCALHPDLDPNLCKCDQACSSYDATAGDNPFIDKNGHGTMVASVFAAKSNNGYRHSGISGELEVMCIKVDDNQGRIYFSAIAKAGEYMLKRNVKIVNFSLTGFGRSTTEAHVFQRLENEGVLVITAAGNFGDSKMNSGCNIDAVNNVNACQESDGNKLDGPFPAAYGLKNVIVVAASNKEGKAWTGSNYGSKSVDLFAPGVKINVLHPSSTLDVVPFTERNGTSFAAAMVTGTILELLRHDPTLSVMEAKDLVLDNTQKVVNPTNLTGLCKTGGILNAHAAMVALSKRKPCTNDSYSGSPTPTTEKIKAYEKSQCFTNPTTGYLPQYDCEMDAKFRCPPKGGKSSSAKLIAGIVIGVLGGVALLAGGGLFLESLNKGLFRRWWLTVKQLISGSEDGGEVDAEVTVHLSNNRKKQLETHKNSLSRAINTTFGA